MHEYTGKRDNAIIHRSDVAAVDKILVGIISAAKNDAVVGVMAAVEHQVAVAPGNIYGTAGSSALVAVTPTLNKAVDITIPRMIGASYYDVFFSTDAAPKWLARITEAQRISGCIITDIGTVTTTGATVGKVTVKLVGTGLATTADQFKYNGAFLLSTPANQIDIVDVTAAKNDTVTGVMAATAHKVAVSPGNSYGNMGLTTVISITPTLNKCVDITIPAMEGATYYDVFFSTDAAPLWLARVTEAERASGCVVTAVNTVTTTGGAAGKVTVKLVGTGAATTAFAVDDVYVMPIPCVAVDKAYIHCSVSVTDLRSVPSFGVVVFAQPNNESEEWFQLEAKALSIVAGAAGQSLKQVFVVNVDCARNILVMVDTMSGQGTRATITVDMI